MGRQRPTAARRSSSVAVTKQCQSCFCFTGLLAARRRKGKPMAQEHTCDCCKRCVEVVNEAGLCFVCNTFQTFTAIIKDETDMNDEDALDLAGVLSDHILFTIIERLQVSNPSLLNDLLQTTERREQSH